MRSLLPELRSRLAPLRHFLLLARWRRMGLEGVFTDIYRRNLWDEPGSTSGPGSIPAATRGIRVRLPALLRELGVRSLLDVPCGDLRWIRETELDLDRYIGADIVGELVARNAAELRSGPVLREFLQLDLTRDPLPSADLILCRDCLVHLPLAAACAALANIRASGSRYLLTTTFRALAVNRDIPAGLWRPLNLELPPFGLPAPMRVLDEEPAGKSLGLWPLQGR